MLNILVYIGAGVVLLVLIILLVSTLSGGKNESGPGQVLPAPDAAPDGAGYSTAQPNNAVAPTSVIQEGPGYRMTYSYQRKLSPGLSAALAVIFILAGVALLFYAYYITNLSQASQSWPTAPGTILSSAIQQSQGPNNAINYSASVRYAYDVAGIDYTGNQVGFVEASSSDSSAANSIVARYPAGQAVEVHYDAANPQNAVLETGSSSDFLALFIVGGGMVLISLYFIYTFIRAKSA
jgi:Protein of unknown function (DUF3592)